MGKEKDKADLLQGTLDLLVLKALQLEPQHGFGIAQRIQQLSSDVLRIEQGSLYPALYRLEERGWIKADWGTSDNNRKAKYYALTRTGRRHLESEEASWARPSGAGNQGLLGGGRSGARGAAGRRGSGAACAGPRARPRWPRRCASTSSSRRRRGRPAARRRRPRAG